MFRVLSLILLVFCVVSMAGPVSPRCCRVLFPRILSSLLQTGPGAWLERDSDIGRNSLTVADDVSTTGQGKLNQTENFPSVFPPKRLGLYRNHNQISAYFRYFIKTYKIKHAKCSKYFQSEKIYNYKLKIEEL